MLVNMSDWLKEKCLLLIGFRIWGAVVMFACSSPELKEIDIQVGYPSTPSPSSVWVVRDFPDSFHLGRKATQNEIDSLSITVFPDGTGLPRGYGNAILGEPIYKQKCAACHGLTGKEGPEDVLVATEPFLDGESRTRKAIGNYWPYATTLFDYIRRSMPLNAPGSLGDEEVYSITAWLLFQNGLIGEHDEVNAAALRQLKMPLQPFFQPDDRTVGPDPVY